MAGTKEMKESCLPCWMYVYGGVGWAVVGGLGWEAWLTQSGLYSPGCLLFSFFGTNDTSVKVNTHFNFSCWGDEPKI